MNMMMAAMAPVMIFLMMGRDMRAMWPGELLFWFVMSLGVVAGFFVAYPINVWLVAKGMKHGLMTVRQEPRSEHPSDKDGRSHGVDSGHSHQENGHQMQPGLGVTRTQIATLTGCTLLALLAGMFVPAAFVNLT